jgi:hypothetical protein
VVVVGVDAGVNPLENYTRQRRAFRSSRLRLGLFRCFDRCFGII